MWKIESLHDETWMKIKVYLLVSFVIVTAITTHAGPDASARNPYENIKITSTGNDVFGYHVCDEQHTPHILPALHNRPQKCHALL